MMPQDDKYGVWPRSGEIDIMESRGNDPTTRGGRGTVTGALHWGPSTDLDMFDRTIGHGSIRRKDFSDDFHIFGVEWSPNYIFTYYDNVLKVLLIIKPVDLDL
jgi:beta-glucanase (GH16 family)